MPGTPFFQISWFLVIGLLLLIALTIIVKEGKQKQINRWWYLIALVVLAGISLFSVRNYIYPSERIFGNTKYHILEHNGFRFDSSLSLVESKFPSGSLWDSKSGSVTLLKDRNAVLFKLNSYYEPFYLSPDTRSNYFKLQNNPFELEVSEGFVLKKNEKTLLELKIIHSGDSCLYLSRTTKPSFDTSSFTQDVYRGYPLSDILLKTPKLDLSNDLRFIIDQALLVRDSIVLIDRASDFEVADENNSPLRFFPGKNLFLVSDISVNEIPAAEAKDTVEFRAFKNAIFYSGVGHSKTDVFKINFGDDKKITLSFLLAKMQELREEADNRLFISSSIEEVKIHKLKGGYLYNIFENYDNLNHINAMVRYKKGSSEESMLFRVKDLYDASQEKEVFKADTVIQLSTKSKENNLKWLFTFHNLRETNSFQPWHINLFITIFLFLVIARLYLDDKALFTFPGRLHTMHYASQITAIEVAILIVVFCFCIVRLLLIWRMSTFVPIEDIDASRFFKLRAGFSLYRYVVIFIFLFFLALSTFKLYKNSSGHFSSRVIKIPAYRKFRDRIDTWLRNSRNRLIPFYQRHARDLIILAYFMIALSLYIITKLTPPSYARLVNISLPVLLYFIFTYLLLKGEVNLNLRDVAIKKFNSLHLFIYKNYPRISLWGITFVYLVFQDSGFSIVFLLYSILHYIFGRVFFTDSVSKRSVLSTVILLVATAVIFYLFLYFQAQIIIFIFKYFTTCVTVLAGLLITTGVIIALNTYFSKLRHLFAFVVTLVAILAFLFASSIAVKINEQKKYVNYRAQMQLPGTTLEDMINNNEFNSNDISFILRSAHNQWFINLYNTNKPTNYFTVQPHFNQGSSYTTQTTDLVVTRYLLAEHPAAVIFLLMILLFALSFIYSLGLNIQRSHINFLILGVFILLFSIAFFVYLSATNRTVFFGQDFPFLSITSKLAIVLPLIVFFIAIYNSWSDQQDENNRLPDITIRKKIIFLSALLIACFSCIILLVPKNNQDNINNFNISRLIEKTSKKIDAINDEFLNFQYTNSDDFGDAGLDKVFNSYISNPSQSTNFNKVLNDSSDKFVGSLVRHFSLPNTNKWDPNELVHVRKRGSFYHITVNRKYYFIESFKDEENKWSGNLLAAPTEKKLGFMDRRNNYVIPNPQNDQVISNILTLPEMRKDPALQLYRSKLNNIVITKLDTGWIDNDNPLYLISSGYGDYDQNKANYAIFNDTITIEGKYLHPAIRLFPGDWLVLRTKQDRGYKEVVKWNIFEESDKYLARNIWLNGKKNLFYPLGKEFMWSYNFANLLRLSLKETKFQDSTIHISIDYDLTRKIYNIIDKENKSSFDLHDDIRKKLLDFRGLSEQDKRDPSNSTEIYLDGSKLSISKSSKFASNKNLLEILGKINKDFHPKDQASINSDLVELIAVLTEKKFDYSVVVLDGYGRIRQLFDYNKFARPDPNNIKDFNRFLSDLYKQSSIALERDFFGNKSISHLAPGPGSSLKPIVFAAVSSQVNFGWESMSVNPNSVPPAYKTFAKKGKVKQGIAFYGGKRFDYPADVDQKSKEPYWNLENYGIGLSGSDYLVHSNNLFHSVVVFLGSQDQVALKEISRNGQFNRLFRETNTLDSLTFPLINYKGHSLAIRPDKWLPPDDFFNSPNRNSVLNVGLGENFHIPTSFLQVPAKKYSGNLYGSDSIFSKLDKFSSSASYIWSYPELSIFNQLDRTVEPRIRNGLIQPSLGSYPVHITPLTMATLGMRLTSLNKADNITKLSIDTGLQQPYKFFTIDHQTWQNEEFMKYYQQHIFKQLYDVVEAGGTAKKLKPLLSKYRSQGYNFYAKTGTINMEENTDERGKHLLLVITKDSIHSAGITLTPENLKHLRYYVVYMSYHGIDKDEFDLGNFYKIIKVVMESELFKKYMNKGL